MRERERVAAQERILKAIRAGNTRTDSYTHAGISMATFYRWLRDDPEWEDKLIQAEATAKVAAVTRISAAAQNGSWQAALAWLERRYPREWGKVENLDVHLKGMNRDELKRFIAERIGPLDGSGTRTLGPPPLDGGREAIIEGDIVNEVHEIPEGRAWLHKRSSGRPRLDEATGDTPLGPE